MFRLTEPDRELLRRAAHKAGVPRSEYVRQAIATLAKQDSVIMPRGCTKPRKDGAG